MPETPPKKREDPQQQMIQAVDEFLKESRELRQRLEERRAKLNGNGKWRIFG